MLTTVLEYPLVQNAAQEAPFRDYHHQHAADGISESIFIGSLASASFDVYKLSITLDYGNNIALTSLNAFKILQLYKDTFISLFARLITNIIMSEYTSTLEGFQRAMEWSLNGPPEDARSYAEAISTPDFCEELLPSTCPKHLHKAGC